MKKTLSVLLAALLLCSLCAIFAAAEDVNPDGYAFNIDSVNVAVAGEKTTIITKQDLIPTANMKWSVNIVLDKVADGLYKAAGDAVPGSGSDPDITLKEGQIILAVHSSTSDPAQIDEYPNVYGKLNAMAIKAGMYIQLGGGIDLTVDGVVKNGTATCTVEDPENGRHLDRHVRGRAVRNGIVCGGIHRSARFLCRRVLQDSRDLRRGHYGAHRGRAGRSRGDGYGHPQEKLTHFQRKRRTCKGRIEKRPLYSGLFLFFRKCVLTNAEICGIIYLRNSDIAKKGVLLWNEISEKNWTS